MSDDIWIKKNLNLEKAFSKGDFSELIAYSERNQKGLIDIYVNSDSTSVEKSLRFGSTVLHRFENGLQNEQQLYAVFRMGALLGTVEGFEALDCATIQSKLKVFVELEKLISEFKDN